MAVSARRDSSKSGAKPSADVRVRAEFPPPAYWRRWCEDAPAAVLPSGEGASAVAEPLETVAAVAAPTNPNDPPYRILIVEDDRSQALYAESVLNGTGMDARVVSVAGEMMAAMEDFVPDLVLMDLHMPGMSGTELTAQIREHASFSHTPVVFLTGDTDPERQVEVLDSGADDYLSKPVRPRHLVAAVQNRVKRSRALRQPSSSDARKHPVTGLFTRTHMLQHLTASIPQQSSGAIYFIEIESTLALRDRYGYAALDSVLSEAAREIGVIAGEQSASRLNDNTFLVFAPNQPGNEQAAWARTLRDGLGRHPFTVNDEPLRLRALIGYADLSPGFGDAGAALAAAEQALRDARAVPAGVAAYTPVAATAHQQQHDSGLDLHGALAGGKFELAYQPIVAVAGGDEAQYQTLLRLRDDNGELHTAAVIIPAAERAGMVHDIDRWVMQSAIDMLKQRSISNTPVRLFVSQATRSLAREGYADWLIGALGEVAIEGASLVIDVRLDDALIHAVSLQEFCNAMVPIGVQLCLSQYQSGDEADALLAQLPLGFVRLSARYASRLEEAVVRDEMRNAIERAHRLGLQVIGQQVEDPQAAATLWISGVDYIQGNLVQRAADALDFDFQHSVL